MQLLKKADLNRNDLHKYHSVSNLPFISKICEWIDAMRLRAHLAFNNINTKFQFADKQFHCTETALLRIINDLLTEMNNHEVSILLLLDLSSTFDTLDHDILINRLHDYAGVDGMAL